MSLQMAAVCLIPFMVASASPSDLSNVDGGTTNHRKLLRRQDFIDGSGIEVNVTIIVPLNNVASSNQTLASNTLIPYTSLVASAFSNGGGNGETISGGTFAGRKSGGGTRNEIYGTARYGGGYGTYQVVDGGGTEYTPDFTLNVAGRDFPHGYPPLTWGNYSGGQEYFDAQISDYPGITPPSRSDSPHPSGYDQTTSISKLYLAMHANAFDINVTLSEEWFIIADGETLDVLNEVLQLPAAQGGCATRPQVPWSARQHAPIVNEMTIAVGDNYTDSFETAFYIDPPEYAYGPYPWNVLQYYRGSSIALGSLIYNNSYAHNGNINTDYWAMSPLNTTGIDMDFLNCLNTTIAAVAPIVNPSLIIRQRLGPGQIAGIVVGTVVGVALILVAVSFFLRRRRQNRQTAALAAIENK
jgi:hypothetical protein